MKKILLISLLVLLAAFQYKLWISPHGVSRTLYLKQLVAKQQQLNNERKKYNGNLAADVASLKKDNTTIEDHARNDLGMIKKGETFYQVIK